ncbi:hypothetical protein [Pseudoduganella umbonata]|uniref:Uncharacterized protein n=1 Tax=Pseudoduganella umbonata TaxID=864828 RepID=A0A4P8HZQ2_9BURK|nr:hypothetical protein [Pseudoduganella umbonata]MBB3224207.1 hypothetical protein [Pseudoduganella umbonata]QCP13935.1 hypothetical protein FCL38_28620 [Pseudoduganella umbonata]
MLNNERTAAAFQGGVQRVMNQLYRHDFHYRHASANCAGVSIDVFDSLGWHSETGATAPLKSIAAYAYTAASEGSLRNGRNIYDYLNEEQTRLLPVVAFEAAGLDLLRIVGATGTQRVFTCYEQQLRSDVDAIFLVCIPQVPSSRATGSAPVFSLNDSARACRKNRPIGKQCRSRNDLSRKRCAIPPAWRKPSPCRSRCRSPALAQSWGRSSSGSGSAGQHRKPAANSQLQRRMSWSIERPCRAAPCRRRRRNRAAGQAAQAPAPLEVRYTAADNGLSPLLQRRSP